MESESVVRGRWSPVGLALGLVILPLIPVRADVCADFEDVPLGTSEYWNGSDLSGGFDSRAVSFGNQYYSDWSSWFGFAYSRVNDTTTPGYGNQYAVISGTGVGGTGVYAVACDDSAYGGNSDTVTLPVPCRVKGFHVNNTTYAVRDMETGGWFSKKFGGADGNDPDWFLLTVTGRDSDGNVTGAQELYLADFRFTDNAQDYILRDWTWMDLTSLGSDVKTLEFTLSSSDVGAYGMNTPAYFAMDNLTTAESYAPEHGQAGSTAVSPTSSAFVAWATGWTNYEAGANCDEMWRTPEMATNAEDGEIVCLGDAGRITLTFEHPIQDGPGPDFAVFENAIRVAPGKAFLEHAWVEVSSDGSNFVRMFNRSLTPAPLSMTGYYFSNAWTTVTDVTGLGCKYEAGFGEPYDLGELAATATNIDLWNVRYVRIIDIVGDGSCTDSVGHVIYDPHPTTGSAGFDLDAVGVLSNALDEVNVTATIPNAAESGPRRAEIVVWRKSWNLASNCTVRLAWSGTASNGVDYAALPASVVIPAGGRAVVMSVTPLADGLTEGQETVVAQIVPDSAYLVGAASHATVYVADRMPVTFANWQEWSLQAGLDDLPTGPRGYWDGADLAGGFTNQTVRFRNQFTDWGTYTSWFGFAYSRVNDTTTPGYGNQYAVISGTGVGGTGVYAIVCDDSAYGGNADTITLPVACRVKGFYVNNTTYAVRDMETGGWFSKKFGGADGNAPDWFLLTVTGRDSAGSITGTQAVYLADFRFADNAKDYILRDWTWLSLTNLGASVKTLEFTLSSSDVGAYGMNTPAYFAMDGLEIDPANPAAADGADWNGDGTPNLMAYAMGYDMGEPVAGAVMTTTLVTADGHTYFEVEYLRRHGLADATLAPVFATNLNGGSWSGGSSHVQESVTGCAGDRDIVHARLLDSATNAVGFVRLQASRP